jgi:ABC-type transport system involved in cytochrome c biogenesis permease subunit
VILWIHHLSAASYLLAGILSGLGLALAAPRLQRLAMWVLGLGAIIHAAAFGALHTAETVPPLTDLPSAVSFMALAGTCFYLVLLLRARLAGLVVLVGPAAFLGVFFSEIGTPEILDSSQAAAGSLAHAHVLLASAGLASLGVAAMAGILFLSEHGRLKAKRPLAAAFRLPSLESLDRGNLGALAIGFPLLTLGVITGMMWNHAETGRVWSASPHEVACLMAWAVYAVLAAERFGFGQGSRQAALAAVGSFAVLFVAMIGVGLVA